MEFPKIGIVIKKNSLYDSFDSTFSRLRRKSHPDVMSIMMDEVTVEATLVKIERKINLLMKFVEQWDWSVLFIGTYYFCICIVQS